MDPWERTEAGFRRTPPHHGTPSNGTRAPEPASVATAAALRRVRHGNACMWPDRSSAASVRERQGRVLHQPEDETGITNVIVASRLFESERLKITREPFLQIRGVAQQRQGTTHVQALRIEPLEMGRLRTAESHDFG